jgi:opacity protein-like surface antigen
VGTFATSAKCGLALGAIAALTCLSVASRAAAHEPASAAWSGVYIGASIGGAWGDAGFAVPDKAPGRMDLDSVLAGGFHIGVQRQWGHIVGGIETSVLFGDFSGATSCPNDDFSCSVDVNWIWMIGPRLGIAMNTLHFYATGGYALGNSSTRVVEIATSATEERGHGHNSGWYVGGGVEWSLGRAMVLAVEYRRIELDDDRHFSPTGVFAASREVDATIDTIQARLSFKLGDLLHGMPSR